MSLTTMATSGPLWVALPLAVAAGAVSFASPCVVPLVPGYLAYLAGLVGADRPPVASEHASRATIVRVDAGTRPDAETGPEGGIEPEGETGPGVAIAAGASVGAHTPGGGRSRVIGAAALFVAGFTAVFVAGLGAVLWLADALLINQDLLQRLGGVVTVAMGLVFVGLVPALQRDTRPHWVPRAGLLGAPLLGATFGLGWTPCLGPTLTGVVALASGVGGTGRGLILILAYCAGLGAPFVLIASGTARAVRAQTWLRRHTRTIQLAGGVLLIAVGIALATGLWAELVALLRGPIAGFSTPI